MVLVWTLIRMCAAVVDAAGNRVLEHVRKPGERHPGRGPARVHRRADGGVDDADERRRGDRDVRLVSVAKWKPLTGAQVGQASAACDTQTGNTATNDVGVAGPRRSPTSITDPWTPCGWLPRRRRRQDRVGTLRRLRQLRPARPGFQPLPAAAAPTLAPTLNAVEPTTADGTSAAHGSGGTPARRANVAEMAAARRRLDVHPARTNAQVCSATAASFTAAGSGGQRQPGARGDPVAADSTEPPRDRRNSPRRRIIACTPPARAPPRTRRVAETAPAPPTTSRGRA